MDKTAAQTIARAIENVFISPNESDSNYECANIVDGLFAIARAISRLANATERLGMNEATTPMGAIETLSLEVKNGMENLSNNVGYIAGAIRDKNDIR